VGHAMVSPSGGVQRTVLLTGVLLICVAVTGFYSPTAETPDPSPLASAPIVTSSVPSASLAVLVNDYRVSQGLERIPLSASLDRVAEAHVWDLEAHPPDNEVCNLHSWSESGSWTTCCYTADHAAAQCMWDKPREITEYPGHGFETAAFASPEMTAPGALEQCLVSGGHASSRERYSVPPPAIGRSLG